MSDKELSVRLYGLPVGILEQKISGKMYFTYLEGAPYPLSMGMPLNQKEYDSDACEAFFSGLLPESADTKKTLGKRFGVSPNNTFSMLREIGNDCAGAVSLHPLETPVIEHESFALEGRVLSDEELLNHINELPKKPLFIGIDDLRLSLAGAQDKAAVCVVDGQIAIPQQGCPTTHILKPGIEGFAETVQNEYFCMRLAKRLGLNVAEVEIKKAMDTPYLLVERYDRIVTDNQIRRIHQEDFCQALGVASSNKYQKEGGPGLKQCFDLLTETATPAIDRNHLARAIIFNYLIGNNDAHAKNFSLLHPSNSLKGDEGVWEVIQMAPLYDLLSTHIYKEHSKKMAMKIGSDYVLDDIQPRHWQQLCKEGGYSYPALKQMLLSQAEIIVHAAEKERELLQAQGFSVDTVNEIIEFLRKHSARTIKRFIN